MESLTFHCLGPQWLASVAGEQQVQNWDKTSGGGCHSNIVELLMLVNQPQKWTLNGVISVGVFATLNGVTLRISNPKWRDKPKFYPNGVFFKTLP